MSTSQEARNHDSVNPTTGALHRVKPTSPTLPSGVAARGRAGVPPFVSGVGGYPIPPARPDPWLVRVGIAWIALRPEYRMGLVLSFVWALFVWFVFPA